MRDILNGISGECFGISLGREYMSHAVVATAWCFAVVCWEHTSHAVVVAAWCFAVARFLCHAVPFKTSVKSVSAWTPRTKHLHFFCGAVVVKVKEHCGYTQ